MKIKERKELLEVEIVKRQKQGWLVTNRTNTSCQFTKDKKPNGCLGVLICMFSLISGVLYFCLGKKIKTLFININENGEVEEIYNGKEKKQENL